MLADAFRFPACLWCGFLSDPLKKKKLKKEQMLCYTETFKSLYYLKTKWSQTSHILS